MRVVDLIVTDTVGATAAVSASLVVREKRPPVADAYFAKWTFGRFTLVAYSCAESSDPDGHPWTCAWNFGDGQTSRSTSGFHAWSTAGSITVRLVVTDARMAADTAVALVTVVDEP